MFTYAEIRNDSFFISTAGDILVVAFDASLIHHLPPTVAEWLARESIEFSEAAEAAGMFWAQAHFEFTGQLMRE